MAYPGGKGGSGVYQAIINQMPPHRIYIEAFLGNGSVMRNKRPAAANIGIDLDAAVISFWKGDEVPGLQLIQADAVKWVASNPATDDTLVYCDPPYLMSTRRQQRHIYRCELEQPEQHEDLLKIVKGLDCMVMISGYYSELYADQLAGWRAIQYTAQTRGGRPATEWLWMNYPKPLHLHDYRYLGDNFRERERISRKRKRWIERLHRMEDSERYSLLSAIQDLKT
jgi:site-specific DNA-adenine methylase